MTINLSIPGFSARTIAEGPVYRDARVMRIVLDELLQAVTDTHLPLDREHLIAMLMMRDARTAARIDDVSPRPVPRPLPRPALHTL
jgi:hypothetical protein